MQTNTHEKLPDWVMKVVADPSSREPLAAAGDGVATIGGDHLYPWADGVLMLIPEHVVAIIDQHEDAFPVETHQHRVLAPDQLRFRTLLQAFSRDCVKDGATIVDIGANDAEFFDYFPQAQYIPVDLSPSRLRRGLERRGVNFVICAHASWPPFLPESIDAVVSTNTLPWLTDTELTLAVEGSLSLLRSGGHFAMTVQGRQLRRAVAAISESEGKIDQITVTSSPMNSRMWRPLSRAINKRLPRLPKPLRSGAKAAFEAAFATAEIGRDDVSEPDAHVFIRGRRA